VLAGPNFGRREPTTINLHIGVDQTFYRNIRYRLLPGSASKARRLFSLTGAGRFCLEPFCLEPFCLEPFCLEPFCLEPLPGSEPGGLQAASTRPYQAQAVRQLLSLGASFPGQGVHQVAEQW